MVKASSANLVPRAPRVKLAGTVLSLVRLENGRQTRGKLHQLSITGGLLHLETPLDEGTKVEVLFHLGSSTVRTKARMLFPMWATQGYLQPFEFDELDEEDRCNLRVDLQRLLDCSGGVVVPAPAEGEETSSEIDLDKWSRG
ncbi:MAG TPA: hypothetical protein VNZ03_26240 [Terriglobales bacterium]|jgi:hypothetical protein|nr:hypothetical protein [Terriglobales bacterium]